MKSEEEYKMWTGSKLGHGYMSIMSPVNFIQIINCECQDWNLKKQKTVLKLVPNLRSIVIHKLLKIKVWKWNGLVIGKGKYITIFRNNLVKI